MSSNPCKACSGQRLKPELLSVFVGDKSIMDLCSLSIQEACDFFKKMKLSGHNTLIGKELVKEIFTRLEF